MKKIITLLIFLSSVAAFAQTGQGAIYGVITDSETGEPIPFANVFAMQNGIQILGTTTDFDGKYTLRPLDSGSYFVEVTYVSYQTKRITEVIIYHSKTTHLNTTLSMGGDLNVIEFETYHPAIFSEFEVSSVKVIPRLGIIKISCPPAVDARRTMHFRVSTRENSYGGVLTSCQRKGNPVLFVDGVKVTNDMYVPKPAIQEVSFKNSGISSQYENGGIARFNTTVFE